MTAPTGTIYTVVTEDADGPVDVEVRPAHWLRLERDGFATKGTYEQVLRVIHYAAGTDAGFDDWADTLVSWTRQSVAEVDDADSPTDQQPGTSPS